MPNIDDLAARLEEYEAWQSPTKVDFARIVGNETWAAHWARCEAIIDLMREAQRSADEVRTLIATDNLKSVETKRTGSHP